MQPCKRLWRRPNGIGPKQRGLALTIERAARSRWRYLNDKRRAALRIVEDQ